MATNGGIGYNPRGKRRGHAGIGAGAGAATGGASGIGGPLASPPSLTFDPAIEAQRRAAQRGLHDTEQDVRSKEHFTNRDLGQALRTIRIDTTRKRQDIGREAFRGNQKLDLQQQDVQTRADRAQQDFGTQLQTIARQFGELGHRQGEAANAAGVSDAGTAAASAAARQRNQTHAEEPIHTAQGRAEEDLATALSRIGVGREEIGSDTERALKRLAQDRNLERLTAHREAGRKLFYLDHEVERARREAVNANIDSLMSEIYQARQNYPGAFSQWAKGHPQALASAKAGGPRHRRA